MQPVIKKTLANTTLKRHYLIKIENLKLSNLSVVYRF